MITRFVLLILILISCNTKKDSFGPYDRLIVFGNPDLWSHLKEVVKDSIGRTWYLPRSEEKILINYKSLDEFDTFKTQRNIMFLIALDKNNSLLQFAKALLSERALKAVQEHSYNFFFQKNIYAERQSLLMFIVDKTDSAENVFKDQITSSDALQQFDDYLLTRLREDYFNTNSDEQIIQTMSSKSGFFLRAPSPFILNEIQPIGKHNILSIYSQQEPLKWVSIHTIDSISAPEITPDFVYAQRDTIMANSFEKQTVVNDNSIEISTIAIDGLTGTRYQGSYIYFQEGLLGGGPFILYALFDESSNRLYLIDGFLFELEKRKTESLIYIEEIMKTFKRVGN